MDMTENTLNVNGIDSIFWGYILVLIDIRIGGFDIFANFIGFILIILGLTKLSHYHKHFKTATTYAGILCVISLFDLYQESQQFADLPFFMALLTLVGLVLTICLYYYLIYGIIEIAKLAEHTGVQEDGLSTYRWLYGINIVTLVSFLLTGIELFGAIAFVSIIIGLFVQILFLCFLKRSQSALHGKPISLNASTIVYE